MNRNGIRSGLVCQMARGPRPGGLVLLATFMLAATVPAGAQLSVDQLSMVLPVTAGQPRLGIITVKNDGTTAAQALVTLEDWDRDEFGNNQFHPLGTVQGSCGRALQVFPLTLSLDPGAEQAIRISLDSAASVTRECWALAVVEKVEPPVERGTGVQYRIRTATKVYLQPPGLPLLAEVQSMRVGRMAVAKDTVRGIEVVVHNVGGRHLEGATTVQVRRADNTVVHTLQMPRAHALPGAIVRLRAAFPDLPPGRYVLLALLDYGAADMAAGQIELVER